ncbi:hypothetical protein JI735_33770 (plasmid) [Paenibacillus sonchi]|uniref:Uncharacterized protein n=1 Tax=Paenibacillus sonchi TaxID=373687 RepID=A0A974PIS6_9BACL|nr:hypothetical protein [Paenibacillus sonchi]QQZ64621.1 hypothetical protein JI735_33770 [Paenibacillus sonchi]
MKKKLIIALVMLSIFIVPIQSFAASTDITETTSTTNNIDTSPGTNYVTAGYNVYPFSYNFSNQIATPGFLCGSSMQIELTSDSIAPDGTFRVRLQYSSSSANGPWSDTGHSIDANRNGTSSGLWYGLTLGYYRFIFDQTGGYTVDGYGKLTYY